MWATSLKLPKSVLAKILLLLPLTLLPSHALAYPVIPGNSTTAVVAPYDTPVSGTGNIGISTTGYREYFTYANKYRIRQTGTVTRVRFYVDSPANVTGLYIKIWRYDSVSGGFDLVGTSNDISGSLTASGFNTIDLSSPITGVQAGDYFGFRIEASGGGTATPFVDHSFSNATMYYTQNSAASASDFNWVGQSVAGTSRAVPIQLYMTAPQVVFIGDSLVAGHRLFNSYLEASVAGEPSGTIPTQFAATTSYSYQNMGIGGQSSTSIKNRFSADVVNASPRMVVVVNAGANDNVQTGGASAKTTFLNNWTTMLNLAQANNITFVAIPIMPETSFFTNADNVVIDDWNASLRTLISSYSNATYIDGASYIGQFRSGGSAGNLWDLNPSYADSDGAHLNSTGYGVLAQAIVDGLKPRATITNNFSTWQRGNVTLNYTLFQQGDANTLNLSQTATSGVEYSTDGSTWYDATDAGGSSEGLTGLASSQTGTAHTFIWDSAADLPSTEDSSVYLRIRPRDSTDSATSWQTTSAFGIDNVAPSGVGVPSFGTITTSSIEIIKPSAVTEGGSLYQWQPRQNTTSPLGLISVSNTATASSLSANTQYTFDAQYKDSSGNTSGYGTSVSKYTLAPDPTALTATASGTNTLLTTGRFANDTSGSSGYYFSRAGANSGWIQTPSWQDTTANACDMYTYTIKYRNGDGVETNTQSIDSRRTVCGSRGGVPSIAQVSKGSVSPLVAPTQPVAPLAPTTPATTAVSTKAQTVAEIKNIQALLATNKTLYPEGLVTGTYGPLTRKAVERFQLTYGVVASKKDVGFGILGPKTKAKIAEVFSTKNTLNLANQTKTCATQKPSEGC